MIRDTNLAEVLLSLNGTLQVVPCLAFREPHMSCAYVQILNSRERRVEKATGSAGLQSCLFVQPTEILGMCFPASTYRGPNVDTVTICLQRLCGEPSQTAPVSLSFGSKAGVFRLF